MSRNAAGPQPNGVLPHPGTGRSRWSLDSLPREQHFHRQQCSAAGPQPNGVLPHPGNGRSRWSLDFLPREQHFHRQQCSVSSIDGKVTVTKNLHNLAIESMFSVWRCKVGMRFRRSLENRPGTYMMPARMAVCFFVFVGAVVEGQINLSGNAVPDAPSSRAHFKTVIWEGEAPAEPKTPQIQARQEPRPPGFETGSRSVETKQFDVVPVEAIGLENVFRLTEQIFSGSEPDGQVGFASLQDLGIKTIVSVDGARPKADLARERGMRYVHIPIGYDGVSNEAGAMLARLVTEATGPIYIHCHHGKHRGPAAAAVACLAAGSVDRQGARTILERAGTSKDYAGLWRDVQKYVVPDASEVLPPLVEAADVGSLATAMAHIDRTFDNVKRLQAAEWTAPVDHPDLDASHEALMLQESFHEAARNLEPPYDETSLVPRLLPGDALHSRLRLGLCGLASPTVRNPRGASRIRKNERRIGRQSLQDEAFPGGSLGTRSSRSLVPLDLIVSPADGSSPEGAIPRFRRT